jgi:hypothetical protein
MACFVARNTPCLGNGLPLWGPLVSLAWRRLDEHQGFYIAVVFGF